MPSVRLGSCTTKISPASEVSRKGGKAGLRASRVAASRVAASRVPPSRKGTQRDLTRDTSWSSEGDLSRWIEARWEVVQRSITSAQARRASYSMRDVSLGDFDGFPQGDSARKQAGY